MSEPTPNTGTEILDVTGDELITLCGDERIEILWLERGPAGHRVTVRVVAGRVEAGAPAPATERREPYRDD